MKPIPEGDRFADNKLFRVLGTGAGQKLYEVWEDAVHAYVADQLREAQVKVLREAADGGKLMKCSGGVIQFELRRMADELEKQG